MAVPDGTAIVVSRGIGAGHERPSHSEGPRHNLQWHDPLQMMWEVRLR